MLGESVLYILKAACPAGSHPAPLWGERARHGLCYKKELLFGNHLCYKAPEIAADQLILK